MEVIFNEETKYQNDKIRGLEKMNNLNLYKIAKETIRPVKLKRYGLAGHVCCALETKNGNIYTGVCIDLPCSIGFCAEHAAIAEMLKNGETQIRKIIAVDEAGNILSPCGRCRELMSQIDNRNIDTVIVMEKYNEVRLEELLPERWDK